MSEHKKKSWISYLVLSLTTTLILAGVGFLSLLAFGLVSGEEFSPDDFSRRRFEYFRLPLLNWVVRGIEYQDLTTDFEKSLGTDGWITTTPASTYHLYREPQSVQPADCDARFLVELLQIPSDSSEYQFFWEEWNQDLPDLARVFWPLMARLARDEMYLAIPELAQLAMDVEHRSKIPKAADFERELTSHLATAYQSFAELDQSQGRTERAKIRFQHAAEFRTE